MPQVQTLSAASSVNYTQLFSEGTSITMTVNGIGQNSTQQSLLFNPAVVSRFAMGFNQPLLSGFGTVPNKRFLLVARNDLNTSEQLFRQQVVATIVQIENAYWDLVAAQQAIAAASIVAKVTRDRLMRNLDIACPSYGFGDHVGYATLAHRRAIEKLGASPYHRRSFAPITAALAKPRTAAARQG